MYDQSWQILASILSIGLIFSLSIYNLSIVGKIVSRQTYPSVFNTSLALAISITGSEEHIVLIQIIKQQVAGAGFGGPLLG